MLIPVESVRVTIYLKEDRVPAVLDFLFNHQVAEATAVRAYAGFGSHHPMHSAALVDISIDLPVIVEFIEKRAKLDPWLPELAEVVKDGLVSTQEVLVFRPSPSRAAEDSGSLLR